MTKYECLFVLSTKTLDDAALEATTEKFKDLITKNGGVIENVDVWGKRRLAYAINYEAITFSSTSRLTRKYPLSSTVCSISRRAYFVL